MENPTLLLIDVQREYFTRESSLWIPDGPAVLARLSELLAAARRAEAGIVHVQHHEHASSAEFATGTPMVETMAEVAPQGDEPLVVKHDPGSFNGTDLDAILARLGTKTLVIGGFMTHMCCDTTAREASARGFDVVFLTDGTATRDLEGPDGAMIPHTVIHQATLAAQADGFSTLHDVASVRDALER